MTTKTISETCQRHTKGDGSWWEYDARGIVLCRVCCECADAKLAKYRPEVLTDSNYEADEDIEGDDPAVNAMGLTDGEVYDG